MSWILREGDSKVTVTELFTLTLLGVCPQEGKSLFWNMPRSSADPPRIALFFEDRAGHPNLHCQTPLVIPTFSIEYP